MLLKSQDSVDSRVTAPEKLSNLSRYYGAEHQLHHQTSQALRIFSPVFAAWRQTSPHESVTDVQIRFFESLKVSIHDNYKAF